MTDARKSLLLGVSVLGVFATSADAAVIGVYSENGSALSEAGDIVSNQGHTFRNLNNLSSSSLSGLDMAWYMNESNGSQGQANNAGAIEDFVSDGGTFVMNDRNVDNAGAVVPGSDNFNFVRDTDDEIDVENDSTTLTDGPGGVIDDSTLDGGNFSNHGYVEADTLLNDATSILNTGSSDEIVDFTFSLGAGHAHYSTIPLDFYVDGGGANSEFDDTYAPNLVDYGANLDAQVPAPSGLALLGMGLTAFGLAPVGRRRQA